MMKKTVLMLLKNHFINDNRVFREAFALKKHGYNVQINCLHDVGLPKSETMSGFKVNRIQFYSRTSNSRIKQLIPILLFAIKSLFNTADIIHCHDIDVLPIGVLIKIISFGRKKIVYDAHEYETERNGIKGWIQTVFRIVERICIKFVDEVITVSDSIANEYVRLYSIKKPTIVLNIPTVYKVDNKKDLFRKKFNIPKSSIIFLYQGGIFKRRGIEELLTAFKNVEKNKVIVFMGDGNLTNKVKEASKEYKNIFYHEAVDKDVLLEHTSSADIGFLILDTTCLSYYYASPNKFFEYIHAGIPVIISDLYDMKKILSKYKNGLVLENTSLLQKLISSQTKESINKMKKNIPTLQKMYTWGKQEIKLIKLYKSL